MSVTFIKLGPITTALTVLGYYIGCSWFGPWFLVPAFLLTLDIEFNGEQK